MVAWPTATKPKPIGLPFADASILSLFTKLGGDTKETAQIPSILRKYQFPNKSTREDLFVNRNLMRRRDGSDASKNWREDDAVDAVRT
ncbi:MAG: hypothetical protein DMG06_21980 [Acidobacteria bacterium]|nr:MAG: hypothetical protein DMG06_21980 [Acidobacteriota bacterium]